MSCLADSNNFKQSIIFNYFHVGAVLCKRYRNAKQQNQCYYKFGKTPIAVDIDKLTKRQIAYFARILTIVYHEKIMFLIISQPITLYLVTNKYIAKIRFFPDMDKKKLGKNGFCFIVSSPHC
jgi:hypothetical protein